MKVIEIVAVPYNALPCEAQSFTLNGMKADKDDFGEQDAGDFDYEYEAYDDECYSCADNHFVPHEDVEQEVLGKYNITEDQYREVQRYLEEKFHVGHCGWCV